MTPDCCTFLYYTLLHCAILAVLYSLCYTRCTMLAVLYLLCFVVLCSLYYARCTMLAELYSLYYTRCTCTILAALSMMKGRCHLRLKFNVMMPHHTYSLKKMKTHVQHYIVGNFLSKFTIKFPHKIQY